MSRDNTMISEETAPDRRTMVKLAAVTAGLAAVPSTLAQVIDAGGQQRLNIGLIGCGGRGTGAAYNAMDASPDARVVAMADVFPDSL